MLFTQLSSCPKTLLTCQTTGFIKMWFWNYSRKEKEKLMVISFEITAIAC